MASSVLASLMIKLGLDASGVAAGAKKTQGILGGLQDTAGLAAAGAGFAIGDFVTSGIQDFARLDTKMREVFTLLPGISGQARDELTQDARDFAKQFGVSTDEAIGGLYQSLSAGVPKDDVFAFMETAQMAATGGVTDLTSAVGLLSAVTKGYGDTSEAATTKASDLAFTTVKLGQTTFPELSTSIGKVIPMANALGVSQEELFGSMATLTGVTGSTAEVSTQLKAAYQALLKERGPMTAMLREQGFESGRAAVEALGLQGAFGLVVDAADGNTTALGKMLGSSEALTAVLQLTGTSAEKWAENIDEMGDAAGSTQTAFREMDSGIAASGRKIGAFFHDLKLTVGKEMQALGPIIYAFGPSLGRNLGRAFGAGFGLLATRIPRLMAPVLGAMGAAITGGNFMANLSGAMAGGLTKGNILSSLKLVGGSWGRVLGVGAAAAMGLIIVAKLNELQNVAAANAAEAERLVLSAEAQKLFDRGVTRKQAEAELAALRGVRGELDGIEGALFDISALPIGADAVSFLLGANPSEVARDIEVAYVEYLASGIPDTVPSGLARKMGNLMSRVVEQASGIITGDLPLVDTLDTGLPGAITSDFAAARQAALTGFGSVKAALANPPQLISRKDRIENMEGRMKKVMANLRQAVKVNDPINIEYWSKAAIKQQGQLDKMKGRSGAGARSIRAKFKAMGVSIEDTWLGVRKKAKSSSQGARDDATDAATETVSGITGIFGGADLFGAGYDLIVGWAGGLRAAMGVAVTAARDVAAAVAVHFETHSPPKAGPLSGIDRWGPSLIDVWAKPIEAKGVARARRAAGKVAGAFAPAGGMPRAMAGAAAGGGDTIQVGVLVADEAGLDELERRMGRRRRRTSRSRGLYNDPN